MASRPPSAPDEPTLDQAIAARRIGRDEEPTLDQALANYQHPDQARGIPAKYADTLQDTNRERALRAPPPPRNGASQAEREQYAQQADAFGKQETAADEAYRQQYHVGPTRQEAIAAAKAEEMKPGWFGIPGTKLWQSVRRLGAGGGRAIDSALESMGVDPNSDVAQWFRERAQAGEIYSERPVEGETTWADVKKAPTIGSMARFVLEQGVGSVPDMTAFANPVGIAAYVGMQSGSIGQQRAENDGRTDAKGGDVLAALPAATISAGMERLGLHGIFGAPAKKLLGRIVQAFGAESLTEAAQSSVEYAGSNLGTEKGFDVGEMGDQALAGAFAGGAMGGTLRGGVEAHSAVALKAKGVPVNQGTMYLAGNFGVDGTRAILDADPNTPIEQVAHAEHMPKALQGMTTGEVIAHTNALRAPAADQGAQPVTAEPRPVIVAPGDAESPIPTDIIGRGRALQAEGLDPETAADRVDAFTADPANNAAPSPEEAIAALNARRHAPVGGPVGDEAPRRFIPDRTPPAPTAPAGDFVAHVGQAESSGRANATNPNSTATGAHQFTEGTWLDVMKRNRPDLARGKSDADILALRNNPLISAQMAAVYARENGAVLRKNGHAVDNGTLYLSHFLGAGGANAVLSANPNTPVEQILEPGQISANKSVLAGKTAGQVVDWAYRKMGGDVAHASPAPAPAQADAPDTYESEGVNQFITRVLGDDEGNGGDAQLEQAADAPTEAPQAGTSPPDFKLSAGTGEAAPSQQGGDVAVTSAGREVPVKYKVVEAADLVTSNLDDGRVNPAYPQDRQPRDRSRGASQAQIQRIASELDPRRLGRSVNAADGAPIVSPDNVVESGNGRTLAIQRAYSQGGEQAQRYRAHLESEGFDTSGMKNPVLVRERDGNMSNEDVSAFVREANERDTLSYSAPEQTQADAAAMTDDMLGLYHDGDVDSVDNRAFVRSFMQHVVGANDQGNLMDADGALSQQAVQRIRGALLYRAFGDERMVSQAFEATDSNIRALAGALTDVAAQWAKLRAAIASGGVDPAMDITPSITEAVNLIDRARREKRSVADLVGQRDAFSGALEPMTEGVLTLFFNGPRFTQPASRARVAKALRYYVDEAMKAAPGGGLFGDAAKPGDILELAKKKNPDENELPLNAAAKPEQGAASGARGGEPAPRERDAGSSREGASAEHGGEAQRPVESDDLRARPELGPTFGDPKGDLAELAVLRSTEQGRRTTKEPLTGNWKWLLRNGFATAAKGGKLTLTPEGERRLTEIETRLGVPSAPISVPPSANINISDMPSGKSVIVRGLDDSDASRARIMQGMPEAGKPLWNVREQGWVISKKHEAKVRAALADTSGDSGNSAPDITGDKINREWVQFAPESGTLGIPRDQMPQVAAEHRGALANFLKARGVEQREITVPAASLKPTQAEFSPAKVQKAKDFEGGNRAILTSADGHVIDGHHQWMAARDKGEDVRAIQLDAPVQKILKLASEFPSSFTAGDAKPKQDALKEKITEARSEAAATGPAKTVTTADMASEGAKTPIGQPVPQRATDKSNPNPYVRNGEKVRFTEKVGYLSPDVTYIVGSASAKVANFTREGTDSSSTLQNYEMQAALRRGVMSKVDEAPEQSPRPAFTTMVLDPAKGTATTTREYGKGKSPREIGAEAFAADAARVPPIAFTASEKKDWLAGWDQANLDAPIEEPKAKPAVSANTIFTDDAAEKARAKLREILNPNRLNAGLDPELVVAGVTLAGYHIEKGARTFAAYSKAMIADLGEAVRPYLRGWYEAVRHYPGMDEHAAEMSSPEEIAASVTQDESSAQPSDPSVKLRDGFVRAFEDGRGFESITEARALAAEILGRKVEPGTAEAKALDEAIETAVIETAHRIAANEDSAPAAYQQLVDLYSRQPKLSVRTSTSMEQQAYSTPVPLAYAAAKLAGITKDSTVYEPTAGNGALLITANDAKVIANELNADRAAALRSLYPNATVRTDDASDYRPQTKVDAVIANPPFGPVRDDAGETRSFNPGGNYRTNEIDHAIALKALEAMKDGGRAVLIVGGIAKTATSEKARSDAYNGKSKREFYFTLYGAYNVTDHFTVAGELYERQGAGWPVDVIVIEGRGKSAMSLPAVTVPRVYSSWDALSEVLNERGKQDTGSARDSDRVDTGERPGARGADAGSAERGGERGLDRRSGIGADDQPDIVRDGSPDGQSDGAGLGAAETRGPEADAAPRPDRPSGRDQRPVETAENANQVSYKPGSRGPQMGTLVPVNMQTATSDALDSLKGRVGDIDKFVGDRLGYSEGDLFSRFGGEQVDAIALALDNIERGAGFIIGDQTGIGKGRVVAAVIRYAMRQNRAPIFVTEKPNLYKDMYRDMADIGIADMLGRDINIVMTDAAKSVPLDDDGEQSLKTPDSKTHNAELARIARVGFKSAGVDVMFTTYSQMQSIGGEETPRQKALRQIASGALLILDESHNAGGQGPSMIKPKQKKDAFGKDAGALAPSRAEFVREMVGLARGVFYSSATYAKRPDVMSLYSATDMRLAVDDISKLGDAIAKGGVPMQQIVAAMLARAGQYVRRERSFDGIAYNTPAVAVDTKQYEAASRVLKLIQQFSDDHVGDAVEAISDELKNSAQNVAFDGALGGAGASSTNFTAIMHNVIDQMLLAFKAKDAADRAIAAVSRGEKPVITLANTLEAMLTQYAEQDGVKIGQQIDITFADVFRRYLERSRWITVKKPFAAKGEKGERIRLTDSQLGPAGVRAFNDAMEMINGAGLETLPGSPIDYMISRMKDAGLKVAEITGRGLGINYRNGKAYLMARGAADKSIAGRIKSITGFNDGSVDVMVLNQSGATGLSLHASSKFKDQRKRRMIIAQAERNIDTHMQMLGRVHRTGQVVLPEYDQLVAAIPAEKRPASVLAKKMASLNANTTASRESAVTAKDVPDFMNEYGDLVASRLMAEEPDIHDALGNPLTEEEEGYKVDGAMRKVTGRIPLLPLKDQEEVYNRLETEYADLLANKEAAGENALEAKTFDLDARVEEVGEAVPAQANSSSPFAAAVNVERMNIKRPGKPYSTETVQAMVEEGQKPQGRSLFDSRAAGEKFMQGQIASAASDATRANMRKRLGEAMDRWTVLTRLIPVGQGVKLKTDNGNLYGIVTSITQTGNPKNPLALGSWKATVALVDSSRQITVPLSQLEPGTGGADAPGRITIERASKIGDFPILEAFDRMQTESRETRHIITGNILAGFDYMKARGQIINFTDDKGQVRQGIIAPRGWDPAKYQAEQGIVLRDSRAVVDFLSTSSTGLTGKGTNGEIVLQLYPQRGELVVSTSKSKRAGGEFFLNRELTRALGSDFVSTSYGMTVRVRADAAGPVAQILIKNGVRFEIPGNASDDVKARAKEISSKYQGSDSASRQLQETTRRDFIKGAAAAAAVAVAVSPGKVFAAPSGLKRVLAAAQHGPMNLADAVKHVAATSQNADFRKLAKRLAPIVDGLNLFATENGYNNTGSAAPVGDALGITEFDQDGKPHVWLFDNSQVESGLNERTLLHETVHAAILQHYGFLSTRLANNPEALQRKDGRNLEATPRPQAKASLDAISRLWDEYGDAVKAAKAAREAGQKTRLNADPDVLGPIDFAGESPDELIAYALTEPEVQAFMREARGPTGKSAWDSFVDWVRGLFGLDPTPETKTMLDDVMDATNSLLEDARLHPEPRVPGKPADNNLFERTTDQPNPGKVEKIRASIDTLIGDGSNLSERIDGWRTRLQDRMLPLLRTQQRIEAQTGQRIPEQLNAYLSEELMSGKVGSRLEKLDSEMVRPLTDAMKSEGVSVEELETYLYARHAVERNARIAEINPEFQEGTGSGMSDAEAASIMERVETEGKLDALQRVAKRVDDILAFAVDTRVEAGLLSADEAEAWRATYQHYVPLRGQAEIDPESGAAERPRKGSGINIRGSESKRAFGRKSRADNILAYSLLQAEEAIVRAGTNEVGQAFYALAKANPDPDFWKINKITRKPVFNKKLGQVSYRSENRIAAEDAPYTVSLKIDGQERRVTMNRANPAAVRLAESMRNLDGVQLNGLLKVMSKINRYLSFVNTALNPEFVITNAFRDAQTAGINALETKGLAHRVLRDYRKALVGSTMGAFGKDGGEWGRHYREMTEAGGRVYFNKIEDLNELQKRIEREFTTHSPTSSTARKAASALFGFIENANLGIENAVRLATFKNARELGMTPAAAASLAKNITVNFNRRGSWGPYMNALYLFYNASMQGSARLMSAMKSPRVRKVLGAAVLTGLLLELMNGMLSDKDDDGELYYDKISDMDKSRNLIVMIPGGQGKYIKIPLPYGYNAFFAIGRTAGEIGRGKKWTTSAGNLASTIADAFNPIGGTNSILNFIAPTVADPIVDLERNRDFADRPIMPDQNPFGPPTPDNQRYWGSVGPHWRVITSLLNAGSGGDEVTPGWIDVSPETLEYLSGTATGAAGAFYDRAGGMVEKVVSGEPVSENDIPLMRKLVGDKPAWYDKSAYYSRVDEIEQAEQRQKEYGEKGDSEGLDKFEDSNAMLIGMIPTAKAAQSDLRKLRKEQRELDGQRDRGEISLSDYRDARKTLDDQQQEIVSGFNSEWNAALKP